MRQATHYHGMSAKSFESWLKGQGKESNVSPWTVSDRDGFTYLWSVAKMKDEDGEEDVTDHIKERAWESGQIQAAMDGSNSIYIFALAYPESMIEDDTSCPNMHYCDRTEETNLRSEYIVEILKVKFNQYLAAFVLVNVSFMDLFNTPELPEDLEHAVNLIKDADIYLDNVYPWQSEENVPIPVLIA